ncbi:hypothetical protein MKW98_014305 [Papaver atlanticum]|uniref:Uncharacterized protein n=1 Tax=Papaver atlanticum TaxID=357466 RepID=A0AAD4SXZ3_9MAGN|nr:hypothetical protein MKW98_014305 [Papaver atlanticum]
MAVRKLLKLVEHHMLITVGVIMKLVADQQDSMVTRRGADGKPQINRSVTRGFCKQLLANALANLENHNKYALGKKEPIVDIDDGDVDNQLAVVEYIEDLYKYYKLAEVQDYREVWSLSVTQPIAGNYYPAIVELQGIKGMWSLRASTDDPYNTFLVTCKLCSVMMLLTTSLYKYQFTSSRC